ncbi:MAG: M48 family metalloprotease [Acidobacteria bacterium]|nr:M48 family metalloprotease [Acidobacteriota bacterium]
MSSRFTRNATALALAGSLWLSAIAAAAQQPAPQQSAPQKSEQKKEAQDKKQETKAQPVQTSKKPLSTDEDPAMIGKRKINSGLFAKLAGGTDSEIKQGRAIAAEIDKQVKFVDDPVVTEYVNRVGQNIVLHSDAKIPFTIRVVDTDEVNAFALPGGFFYVNRGLILAADNEAELAGVMAHEIAHVAARHAMENQAKANALQLGALAGSIFLGGIPGMIFQNTAGLGLLAAFMKFSRNAESEADRLGVQYLYAAGYDPNAMATMFEKLSSKSKKKPGMISKAFSTHPQPPDRRQASLELVARFPEREEYVISTSEFQRVKSRLMRLSNARISTAGDISSDDDNGAPDRPTLKRRQAPTDDPAATPSESKPADPPKLKRNDGSQTSQPTPDTTTTTP